MSERDMFALADRVRELETCTKQLQETVLWVLRQLRDQAGQPLDVAGLVKRLEALRDE